MHKMIHFFSTHFTYFMFETLWTIIRVCCYRVGVRGDSLYTFHFLIFCIFSVFAKTKIMAHIGNIALWLRSELHNFHATSKEVEGEVFP
jgi:hypothetical protein